MPKNVIDCEKGIVIYTEVDMWILCKTAYVSNFYKGPLYIYNAVK